MSSPKFCWDSSVFIALLTAEPRSEEDVAGLSEVIDLVDRREVTVITSSLIRSEVLDDATDPDLRRRLEDLFRRPSCVMVDVNRAISDKAGSLRSACRESGRRLRTPDAVFIATALLHRVDALHSFDDDHLSLSRRPEVDGLLICKPHGTQTILSL